MNTTRFLAPIRFGILFSLLTIALGFFMGMIFGIGEDAIKSNLGERAASVLETVYQNDTEKAAAVVSKSWTYFKRAHMHAGGIGTAALSICLLVGFWGRRPVVATYTTAALGLGGLGYSVFWWLAGLRAPLLGSTAAAKESLAFLAMPSAGLIVLSVSIVLFFWIKDFFFLGVSKNG
ncbi:MAG: hypothetical protein LAT76_07875 [Schleiferiaceae bacterium]|nr:hypothetical protein [Schleiferiaceae bacterium]